jgi:hypothetical protein
MKKSELFLKYLSEEGYSPKVDSDGDITFKREGLTTASLPRRTTRSVLSVGSSQHLSH